MIFYIFIFLLYLGLNTQLRFNCGTVSFCKHEQLNYFRIYRIGYHGYICTELQGCRESKKVIFNFVLSFWKPKTLIFAPFYLMIWQERKR